jgi:hypothetical protein
MGGFSAECQAIRNDNLLLPFTIVSIKIDDLVKSKIFPPSVEGDKGEGDK